ncbi:MAG TPA: NERD domain-containing protein [Puia sp.]|nr:NERD domain-containing protein [Puia sp.]
MRIVPSTFSIQIKSNAEKKTFGLFQKMDWEEPSICFHSLRLSEHQYKKTGELDFVVLCPDGLFVLEVKGGGVSRDESGIWTITDRHLVRHNRRESPFEQASSGLYSLWDSIRERFKDKPLLQMTTGYGVVFPDCAFDIPSVEWSADMIIDKRDFKSPSLFRKSFTRLVRYWKTKSPSKCTLNSNDLTTLTGFLRPKFDLAESLGHRVGEIDRLMVALTSQQYEKLDAIESNPRIICSGGAGTGKTFMALDIAKRLSEQGRKTLFICKSQVFGRYIRARINSGVSVQSFEEIDVSDLYEAIVVDEAQDTLNFEDLATLDRILMGGLEKGIWRIFLDKNNQLGLSGKYEEAAMEMLSLYNPVRIMLSRNCRNTEPIVNAVRLLTASDIGTATAGGGPEVKYIYTSSEQESIHMLEKELLKLLDNEIGSGDISLVSAKDFESSIASKLNTRFRRKITELTASTATDFPFHHISFSTVRNFKGLENRFVFIMDFPQEYFEQCDMAALYVAMTRPRVGLTIILPKILKPLVNRILINNLSILQNRT